MVWNGYIKSIQCLSVGLFLMVSGILLSPRPGTIPFIPIIAVTIAFLLFGKAVSLILDGRSGSQEIVISRALMQYYSIVVLTAFSFQSLCGYFFLEGIPFHDNASFYSLFHDNLQSLNYFGAPAWWFPHNQFGFPGYFYSILGNMNCLSPVFVALATVFWVLGKIGIHITNIMPLYIWYFGAIVPFIFSLSVWFFVRRILTSTAAILFVAILTAFSPGVLLNFGDLGMLEAAAYGLCLAASYIRFIERPDRNGFLVLVLMLLVFSVTTNYTLIVWNLLFLIVLFFVMMFPLKSRVRLNKAFMSVSKKTWAAVALLVIVCLSPPFLTLSQKGDIVRTTTYAEKENRYLHMNFWSGNPLEALTASTPGVGFISKSAEKGLNIVNYPTVVGSGFMGYIYLGFLTVPLLIIGLLYGRPDWRVRIFILIFVFFAVVILANYSPFFLAVLNLNTFLTKNSHFSDALYRGGGFILLVIGAGMGLEAILRNAALCKNVIALFAASAGLSFILYLFLIPSNPMVLGFLVGFGAIMALLYTVILLWLKRGQNDSHRDILVVMFLLLVLCDVSTLAHMHVRLVMHSNFASIIKRAPDSFDAQNSDSIGLSLGRANGQSDTTLSLSSLMDLQKKGLAIDKLPKYALFGNAHISKEISPDDVEDAINGHSLALENGPPDIITVVRPPSGQSGKGKGSAGVIGTDRRTYTSTWLEVSTDKTALLFIKDAYHPYWKAKVNGQETKIYRALNNFKAVIVPKGRSVVELGFSPPGVAVAISMAYLSIFMVFIALLVSARIGRQSEPECDGNV